MNGLARHAGVAVAVALAPGLAGCGGSPPPAPENTAPAETPTTNALHPVAPCYVLSSTELERFGLRSPGKPVNENGPQPGCSYVGEGKTVVLAKNETSDVESFSRRQWDRFTLQRIGDREAATAVEGTTCSTILGVGGGSLVIDVTADGGCADGVLIAETIASRMPD